MALDTVISRQNEMCQTSDNHTLVITRCIPPKDAVTHKHSVVLCHGFASNRFTFDLNPDVSVANYLCSKGWDVWLVELRGSGKNKRNDQSWTFEDHVVDIQTIIEKVFTVSGLPVHIIGHSMGAMLVQCAAAGNGFKRVRSGVAIAGSFRMESSEWRHFLWMWPLVQHFTTIHPEHIQEVLSPISYKFNTPWDQLFFCSDNVDHDVAREMFAKNWEPIPVSLISQLRSAVEPGGLTHANDSTKQYFEVLSSIQVPMLLLSGSSDQQCPPVTMETAQKHIPFSRHICFGKCHGQANEYGHFDLIVGSNAKKEVWDVISEFLLQNDN
jgi:pimeloyl-ACP methyl ester carboxylesterase